MWTLERRRHSMMSPPIDCRAKLPIPGGLSRTPNRSPTLALGRGVLCFGMIEDEKVATLRTVIAESQRLGALALKSGLDSVASLCEQTMRHARAELARLGSLPEPHQPADDPNVVRPKRWRK